jgi:hypothetical protein
VQLKRQEQLQNEEKKRRPTVSSNTNSTFEDEESNIKEGVERIKREEQEFQRQYSQSVSPPKNSVPSAMFKQSNLSELEREVDDIENTRISTVRNLFVTTKHLQAIRSPSHSVHDGTHVDMVGINESIADELEQLRVQLQVTTEKLDQSEFRAAQLEIEITAKDVQMLTLQGELAKRDRDQHAHVMKEYSEKEAKLVQNHKARESDLLAKLNQEVSKRQQMETENRTLRLEVQRLKQELERQVAVS